MSGEKLLPCWHCGGDAEVSYGVGDYDYDGGDRWRLYRAKVMCRCGSELRVENEGDEYLPLERALDFAIEAWNTRAAVTDHDFAMAVHDGNLWGKCSKCKERQGYYMDAETIRNQQEHIAELTVERDAYFEMVKRVQADCDARDELIRDMMPFMCEDDGIKGIEARIRELGIEVDDA